MIGIAPLRAYARDVRDAFSHTPIEVLLGLITVATFSVALERDDWEVWWRIAAAAALALPLVFATSIFHASRVLTRAACLGRAPATWFQRYS